MPTEAEVRKASERFYLALNRMIKGDVDSMSEIWSHGAAVTSMHPIGGRQVGWENVRESFRQVAQIASTGQVGALLQPLQAQHTLADGAALVAQVL